MGEKWINVDAGPRQAKDLEKAIRDLSWEGRTFTELTGVAGSKEHSATLVNVMGAVRAEVTALEDAIKAKHGHQVTKATVRAIIADYAAAMPEARESRPVQDSRRTPEADAELAAMMAARHAEEEARTAAYAALLDQVMSKAPRGAQALIVAELKEDCSDIQTDYSANRTVRTAAIGFRFGSREDFRQLHAAAASFPELAGVTFEEHRDNYSMGAGNYLSDHGWDGAGSGWVVKSCAIPCKYVHITEDAITGQAPAPETAEPGACPGDGVTVSPSSLGRPGVVEVRFAEKPGADVLAGLKARGFRWARGNRCWYGRDEAYASALAAS